MNNKTQINLHDFLCRKLNTGKYQTTLFEISLPYLQDVIDIITNIDANNKSSVLYMCVSVYDVLCTVYI